MASFPSSKVHRPSRRKLGRGQRISAPPAVVTASAITTTVTVTFSLPVIVNGAVPLVVASAPAIVSQTVNSSTQVTIVFAASVVGKTWSIAAGTGNVATYQGGGLVSAGGTF